MPVIPAADGPTNATQKVVVRCSNCHFDTSCFIKRGQMTSKWNGQRWVQQLPCPVCRHPSMKMERK